MSHPVHTAAQAYQRASPGGAREKLILDHLDYARKIVSTLTVGLPEHIDRENLEQAGLTGLVEAAHNYDASLGVKFRTFAFPRIRGAVIDELRRNSLVPQQVIEHIDVVKRAYDSLQGPVTPEQLAEATGLTLATVCEVLEALRFMQPQSWNDLFCHIHTSWKHQVDSPESDVELRELKVQVAHCIERLPDRERLVLTLYFTEDLTLSEIGEVIGVSESRASRILAAAKFRLKEMIQYANQ
ncbi:MAG TPA: sigma-70 family RNA polymerase sigma factor [Pirellulaceae bacterium]|nr:sigma-70 family RNA polymerase sigma factor [Pirellulaceae bacterium]